MTLAPTDYFPARAVIDLEALRHNVRTLQAAAPSSALMAIVKGDAYGHGLVPVARAAVEAGAAWLGVAQVSEALALREAGLTAPVLTWLYGPDAPLDALLAADIDVSVASPPALELVAQAARRAGRRARVHLKVDTGLGRNGVSPPQLDGVVERVVTLVAQGTLDLVGVWSHLAYADVPGHPTTAVQCDVLDDAVRRLESRGVHPRLRHIAASAATLTDPRTHYDLVRPGIALYGLTPDPGIGTAAELGLRPVMRLEADLVTVKPVEAASGVSYGHHYVTPGATVLGVVPVGYADGVPRHVSGLGGRPGAPVRVCGPRPRTSAIRGRVCMDQVVVDLGPGATEQPGDRVVLFGDPVRGEPSAQDWADVAGTIGYEIVTRVGVRVPRVYEDAPSLDATALATTAQRATVAPDRKETTVELTLPTAERTRAFGAALAGLLRAGDLVVLSGALGAGKTTLTQGIATGLDVRGQVASPTFIIARVHPALGDGPDLVHVDAYRLDSLDDLEALDLDTSLEDSVTVVEWGEGLAEVLSEDRLEIVLDRPHGAGDAGGELDVADAEAGARRLTVRAVGERWSDLDLDALQIG